MLKRAAWALGLVLLVAGCSEPPPAGKDASFRRDASRPDADDIIIGDEDSGVPEGADGGSGKTDGGGVATGIGWCNVQSPASGSIAVGAKFTVFGQVYVDGQTSQVGARSDIEGQLGYGAQGSDGASDNAWLWTNATFNKDDGNNDEYQAELSPALGDYSYAYRFRFKGGAWQYCDVNGSADGYDKAKQGALTVTPVVPPKISWCKIVSAAAISSKLGQNALVYGQVLATGVTNVGTGQGAGITGEIGYGPLASDPKTSTEWSWSAATFNKDMGDNDEYEGRLAPAKTGKVAFAYRFRLGSDEAVYCDTDADGAAFSKDALGTLEVTDLTVDWCRLQFPPAASLTPGADFTAFGQVMVKGVTDQIGAGADVEGELGVGATGSNGSTDTTWTWSKATFNKDEGANDEYQATVKAGAVAEYAYAYRFRYKGGAWTWCDLDSSDNGYDAAQQGKLTVATVKPKSIDWCKVQFPASTTTTVGKPATIFGQVYVAGVTEAAGASADVVGELGVGATSADASANDGAAFTWTAATFGKQDGNNDEYQGELTKAATGEFAYAYRFKYQGGAWTYCDTDSSSNGFGVAQQGKLTVVEQKSTVDWCRLQAPGSGSITEGESLTVFGQVFVSGATEAAGQGADVEGEVGLGPAGTDGSADAGAAFTWSAASFNVQVGNNDEFKADLSPSRGDYAYAYRFRYKGGAWTYCDLDSSANGYEAAQQGTLKVNVDYCVLAWPPSASVSEGTPVTVYGQFYKAGVTPAAGASADVTAELGFGPGGTDGSKVGNGWDWKPATFNKDVNNNDEYQGDLAPAAGNYDYAYRFKYKTGAWTYCDRDGSLNGYDKAQQGSLAVAASPVKAMLYGLASNVENVDSKFRVAAELLLPGVTDATGQGAGVTAEAGYGPVGGDPAGAGWTWSALAYFGDAATKDVYAGFVKAPAAGSYDVAVRFKSGGQTWLTGAAALQTFPEPLASESDVKWCNVQWPSACTAAAPKATSCTETPGTTSTDKLYGQVYIPGVTEADSQAAGTHVVAQFGLGADASDPRTADWSWKAADYNKPDKGNNDEFMAGVEAPATAGTYRYVFRFRLDGFGKGWTYCDTDGSNGKEGFDPAKSGTLIVQ